MCLRVDFLIYKSEDWNTEYFIISYFNEQLKATLKKEFTITITLSINSSNWKQIYRITKPSIGTSFKNTVMN